MKRLLYLLAVLAAITAAQAVGPKVPYVLSWTPSPSPDVSGYWVYWRTTTGAYSDSQRWAASTNSTTFDLRLFGLAKNDYYISMTATNLDGAESAMAVECAWHYHNPNQPTNLVIQ